MNSFFIYSIVFISSSDVVEAEKICQFRNRTLSPSSGTSSSYHDSNGNGKIRSEGNRQNDDEERTYVSTKEYASALVQKLGEKGVWPEFIVKEIVELLLLFFEQKIARIDVVQKFHHHKQILNNIVAFN